MKKTAIILAGGSGKRFGSEIPKQFLLLNNKPILIHTILKFYNYDSNIEFIIVLPENQIEYWQNLCKKYNFKIKHKLVKGGKARFYSVKNGLDATPKTDLIAIHDSVRPLVRNLVIKTGFELAEKKGNAIPVIDVKNSYRMLENNASKHIDRDKLKIVQTPQIFKSEIIRKAYLQEFKPIFTDDASVVENLAYQINLFPGNEENIKITTKNDLKIAEII